MSINGFPGYVFHKYSTGPYLKFVRRALTRTDDNRELDYLAAFTKLLPPKFGPFSEISLNKEQGEEEASTNRECDSGQEVPCSSTKKEEPERPDSPIEITPDVDTEDLYAHIIEHLEREIYLGPEVFNDLANLNEEQATGIFVKLLRCGMRNAITFGDSLVKMRYTESFALIQYYADKMLMCKTNEEYNGGFENVFNNFMDQYPNVGKKALLKKIMSNEDEDLSIISQYIASITQDHKTNLLRDFLHQVDRLNEKHFSLLEVLLNDQSDFDLLKKLVEIMCNQAEFYSDDKGFGKLLNLILQKLGKNATKLEQPLKYIIGCHRSIWKIKTKKVFESYSNDSLLLTQRMRF